MPERMPVEVTNLDRYGSPALPWSRPRDLLTNPPKEMDALYKGSSFLSTVHPDGTPHAAGVGAQWHVGDLYFTSGVGTQKSRNLASNPACAIVMSLEGIDLVFEGEAHRRTDATILTTVCALYRVDKMRVLLAEAPYDRADDVAALEMPTLLIFGDADNVRPAHVVEMFRLLGGGVVGDLGPLRTAQFAVLPGTAHSALMSRTNWLAPMITEFLA